MSAALFMDYMYFENKNQGQDNGNWDSDRESNELKIEQATCRILTIEIFD